MSKITFAEDAWEEYLYWQTQDKKTLKKINGLLKAIQRDPFIGEGKPEPLRNSSEGEWSRRINKTRRCKNIFYTTPVPLYDGTYFFGKTSKMMQK